MVQATNILCPDKTALFKNISPTANTVAEHIPELSDNIYESWEFSVYSVALVKSTDIIDSLFDVIKFKWSLTKYWVWSWTILLMVFLEKILCLNFIH